MINGVLHCGCCGRTMRDCKCEEERQAVMRMVCDTLALMNVPNSTGSISTSPGVGGPLVPPGPTPFAPPPIPPPRFVKFGDSMVCTKCNLDARYCRGHAPPSVSAAQDGQAAASLERRARECMGGR